MPISVSKKKEGKALLKQFESTIHWAELRALSKESLERPLNDNEFKRMKELKKQLLGE